MDIGNFQLNLARELKKYTAKLKEKDINSAKSSYTFVATWGENLGFEYLKYRILKLSNFLKFLRIFLKDLYFALATDKLEIINEFKKNKKDKIIFSNASFDDFNNDGSYIDRYFKINSSSHKEFIFIIVYSGNIIPKKIDDNLVLLRRKTKPFFIDLFELIFKFIKSIFFGKKYFFHNYSAMTLFSEKILFTVKKLINFNNIKKIFFPYEGHPFQQELALESKTINKNIKIIGYDHSAPHANPINLLHRNGSPDLLYVNGRSQKNYLVHHLNWPQKKIQIVPSLRYKINSDEKFNNAIFFPWQIINSKIVLDELKFLFENSKPNSLNLFEIKTHPVSVDIKKQLKLKKDIEILMKKYKEKFGNSTCNTSIFIGSTTSVIVALEKGIDTFHICFDPLFESYSQKLWPELNVTSISKNSFKYYLKEKNSFINFGQGEKTFSEYYNN